jgi:hypothetical protein
MRRIWTACCFVLLLSGVSAQGQADVTYELSKIDEGTAWVSSYWGYNTPKLVYDGEAFYTVALWGDEQATATGAVYGKRDGQWKRGIAGKG